MSNCDLKTSKRAATPQKQQLRLIRTAWGKLAQTNTTAAVVAHDSQSVINEPLQK